MPSNKRHHFVPKSYLQNFASNQERKTIRLLNVRSGQVHGAVSIRDQCRRNYFYGKTPELEKAIVGIEGAASTIFRDAIESDVLPRQMTMRYRHMFNFVATQLGRTENAEAELNEFADKFAKHMLSRMYPELEGLNRVKISWKDAVIVALRQALIMSPTLWDLHYCLLDARNNREFVTSDSPVVTLNSFFGHRLLEFTRGLGMRGLQLFLPISPKRAIMFYDPSIYRPHRMKKGVVPVYPEDMQKLNAHTYLNAHNNIYWSNDNVDPDVHALHSAFAAFRIAHKAEIEAQIVERTGTQVRERFMIRQARPDYNPEFRFLPTNPALRAPVLPGFRIPEWMDLVRSYYDAVGNGEMAGKDFFKDYAVKHPLAKQALDQIQRMAWNSALPPSREP